MPEARAGVVAIGSQGDWTSMGMAVVHDNGVRHKSRACLRFPGSPWFPDIEIGRGLATAIKKFSTCRVSPARPLGQRRWAPAPGVRTLGPAWQLSTALDQRGPRLGWARGGTGGDIRAAVRGPGPCWSTTWAGRPRAGPSIAKETAGVRTR